jgi:predicted metal-dependent phosphoesterase TrpH
MHCHTLRSDGNDSPLELIDHAVRLGLRAIGITDHDMTPPLELTQDDGTTIGSVAYAAKRGLQLVLGYEFSCDTYVDDVHICGYGCDWSHADIAAEVAAAKRSKSDAYRELCERLTALGKPVDWNADVLRYTRPDGSTATREPDEVQRKHVFEAIAARGHAATWSDAKLLVRDNPALNVPRRKIDPREAVALIHRSGGIAILAHPYLIDETVRGSEGKPQTRADYIAALIDAGLDGLEASYSYDKTTYKGSLTPEAIEREIRSEYALRVRFLSGGSDYHADHKKLPPSDPGVPNASGKAAGLQGGATQPAAKVRYLGERGLSVAEYEAIFLRG